MEVQQTIIPTKKNAQDWAKYNLAKTNEKRLFYELLGELCNLLTEPKKAMGRPPVLIKDLVFITALKIYNNFSSRKIHFDTKMAEKANYISKAPHFNRISDFLNGYGTYDLFQKLLTLSAMPLACLEDSYSVDASGFGKFSNERWMSVKYQKKGDWMRYMKGHIVCGVRTNVICAAEVTYGNTGDAKIAPILLLNLRKNFKPRKVMGDKAYSGHRILKIIEEMDAEPLIDFKYNTNPTKRSPEIWRKTFEYFKNNQEEFRKKYSMRNNVETTFFMIKSRLGEFLRSKRYTALRNELMMKFIVHNLTCLVQEIYENKVHVNFKKELQKFSHLKKSKDTYRGR